MGATNSTLHYQLSQFISTDKPAWLQDYNGDMQKIDAGINGALTAAESAQNSADSASSGVSSLGDAVSALSTTVSGHTSDITDLSGDVNTIESLIGNGTPTAGDHTLIGAINTNTNDIANMAANNFGTKVDLTSYNSAGNLYTFPSDGYVEVYTPISERVRARIISADGDTNKYVDLNADNIAGATTFVRRGMKCWCPNIGADANAFIRFTPIS